MTFEEKFRYCAEQFSSNSSLLPCSQLSYDSYSKYEIRAFLEIIDPNNSISLPGIATQIKKLKDNTFEKTSAMNPTLYSVINLLSRIEKSGISAVDFCNCITSIDPNAGPLKESINLSAEVKGCVRKIFDQVKLNGEKSPDQAFAWAVRFVYDILSLQPFPAGWNETIALMWFKRVLKEYCNVNMYFPFVDMILRCLGKWRMSIKDLSIAAKTKKIEDIFFVMVNAFESSKLKLAGYPLDRLTPFQQTLKNNRHDPERITKVKKAWKNSSLKSAFEDPDLYTEGSAGRDGACMLLRKVYIGLALESNCFENELEKTGMAYLHDDHIALPDFLELINRGLQFYNKWEQEERHLNRNEKK